MRAIWLALFAVSAATAAGQSGKLSGTVTRFEQSDSRIAYSGTWYPNNNSLSSGDSAILANLKGSQCVVSFMGTGISWIGTSDPFSGYAYIYLDGVPGQIDTANTTGTVYQYPQFTASGLTPGLHTFTIEITHSHDEASNQSWIWVDAFDIENGTIVSGGAAAAAGLVEQTNPAVNYGGHWFQNTGTQWGGGSINSAVDAGAWVSVSFNGTAVDWIGYRDEWSGIAQVYVDGTLQNTVDTYLTPSKTQTQVYSVKGLAFGPHTLKIVATGTQNPASGGPWIWVDAFNVTGSSGPPAVNAGGLVNAATYAPAPNNQVAPGQIVSVFGSGFLPTGRADAGSLPLPTQLGSSNVTVTACGRNIPLYNVFPGQINAQLPFECPATGTTQLTVSAGGQSSAAQTISLAAGSPGIFTVDSSGSGDGVIFHANGSLVSSSNPAKSGEQVVIYGTGLGATTPSFASGAAASANNQTVNPVAAAIGGLSAKVVYSGLTVGFAGLYQINVIVPPALSGSQPVLLTVGSSLTSRSGVNLWVSP